MRLIAPAFNSDQVFEAFLALTGYDAVLAAKKLVDARDKVAEMLELIDSLTGEAPDRCLSSILGPNDGTSRSA